MFFAQTISGVTGRDGARAGVFSAQTLILCWDGRRHTRITTSLAQRYPITTHLRLQGRQGGRLEAERHPSSGQCRVKTRKQQNRPPFAKSRSTDKLATRREMETSSEQHNKYFGPGARMMGSAAVSSRKSLSTPHYFLQKARLKMFGQFDAAVWMSEWGSESSSRIFLKIRWMYTEQRPFSIESTFFGGTKLIKNHTN